MVKHPRKPKVDKATKKALATAQRLIEDCAKLDGNESETRKRVEHIFGSVLGYDVFRDISREYAIYGAGDVVHCDLAIKLDHNDKSTPSLLVELKRVNIELAPKHLRQVASYAIDLGCDWVLLTNGREWRLYHILYGKPPQTTLIESWNLMTDDPAVLARKFDLISYRNVKKGNLNEVWQKSSVLTPRSMLGVLLSEDSIRLIQRNLRKSTSVLVSPEDIVGAIRRLLNEAAAAEMDNVKIYLPEKKQRKSRSITQNKAIDANASPETESMPA